MVKVIEPLLKEVLKRGIPRVTFEKTLVRWSCFERADREV